VCDGISSDIMERYHHEYVKDVHSKVHDDLCETKLSLDVNLKVQINCFDRLNIFKNQRFGLAGDRPR
jgi:hypothetical protein